MDWDFYKKYRQILDGDIIHLRRPDGRDYDAILNVDPSGEIKGLLMVYNPLEEDINKEIRVNLYYTGLSNTAMIAEQDGKSERYNLDREFNVDIPVSVPARSQTWYVIR